MPLYTDPNGKTALKICGAIVVWDAITRPEINDSGKQKWALKVVVNPNDPDLQLLNNLANECLQESPFKGVLPQGGRMPIGTAGPAEFNGLFPGWAVLNPGTYRTPMVYDENGQVLDPMAYGNMLYSGQQVDIVVHCYHYDNKAKGVACGLDGFAIIASANATRQNFGGGGIDAAGAFAGGPAQQQAAPQQQYQQQPAQQQAAPQQQYPQQPQQQQPGGQPQQQQDFMPQN